jgi:hypothetical protein
MGRAKRPPSTTLALSSGDGKKLSNSIRGKLRRGTASSEEKQLFRNLTGRDPKSVPRETPEERDRRKESDRLLARIRRSQRSEYQPEMPDAEFYSLWGRHCELRCFHRGDATASKRETCEDRSARLFKKKCHSRCARGVKGSNNPFGTETTEKRVSRLKQNKERIAAINAGTRTVKKKCVIAYSRPRIIKKNCTESVHDSTRPDDGGNWLRDILETEEYATKMKRLRLQLRRQRHTSAPFTRFQREVWDMHRILYKNEKATGMIKPIDCKWLDDNITWLEENFKRLVENFQETVPRMTSVYNCYVKLTGRIRETPRRLSSHDRHFNDIRYPLRDDCKDPLEDFQKVKEHVDTSIARNSIYYKGQSKGSVTYLEIHSIHATGLLSDLGLDHRDRSQYWELGENRPY